MLDHIETLQAKKQDRLTQARLKEVLQYDPETGAFFQRAVTSSRVRIGDRAGSDNGSGYRRISVDGRSYYAHRLAWIYVFGHFPDGELDHKNHNRSSCRIADLREATPRQNKANSKARKHNRSGLKGVSKRYHRWRAAIRFNGKSVFLGSFATPEAAHAAYCYVAKRLHGEFFCNGKD
jgi:hypothetical protein